MASPTVFRIQATDARRTAVSDIRASSSEPRRAISIRALARLRLVVASEAPDARPVRNVSAELSGRWCRAKRLHARRSELQVPIARIIELAPLLFVIAAENSLKRRAEKLDELETLFEREQAPAQRKPSNWPPEMRSWRVTSSAVGLCCIPCLANSWPPARRMTGWRGFV